MKAILRRLAWLGAICLAPSAFAMPESPELWSRTQTQANLDHVEHPRIAQWEQHWRRRAAELRVIFERRGHWLYPILDALEQRGLPIELIALPIIESKLGTRAKSSKEAYGLWQLRPSTARQLGLRIDEWVDERAHPLLATEAALDYLQKLHDRFGSWPLTLAAYNAGQGRVSRAMRAVRARGERAGYWALDLPSESQDYVPKVLALARVLREVEKLRLPYVDPDRRPGPVPVHGPLSVDLLARAAGISVTSLYAYNPHLQRWALPPRSPWSVLVPSDKVERTRSALAAVPADAGGYWQRVIVRSGDSLGVLAQRWQTSVALIQRSNQLANDKILIGQALWVPSKAEQLSPAVLEAARLDRRIHDPADQRDAQWHMVRAGDTLWSLARKSNRRVRDLRRWNRLAVDEPLIPGQRLRVAPPPGRRDTLHHSQPGESLDQIATQYGVSVAELRRWNRLGKPQLAAGGELLVFAPH